MNIQTDNNRNYKYQGDSPIVTGEKGKFRCYYINHDDKAVSRVLELEQLNHPILTETGVKAWMERDMDCYNQRYGIVYIQLTDKICYRPIRTVCDATTLDILDGQTVKGWYDGYAEDCEKNLNKMFTMIAAIPKAQMKGEYYPNKAVIDAYLAAGMINEAGQLSEHRNAIIAQREAEENRRRQETEERERKAKEEEAAEKARQIAEEEESLRTKGHITGWGVVQLCDREGINIHLRTRHNLLEVVTYFEGGAAHYRYYGKRKPNLDGCFNTLRELKNKLGIAA